MTKQEIGSGILQFNSSLRLKNTILNSILYAIVRYNVIVLYMPIKPVPTLRSVDQPCGLELVPKVRYLKPSGRRQ